MSVTNILYMIPLMKCYRSLLWGLSHYILGKSTTENVKVNINIEFYSYQNILFFWYEYFRKI